MTMSLFMYCDLCDVSGNGPTHYKISGIQTQCKSGMFGEIMLINYFIGLNESKPFILWSECRANLKLTLV